MKRGRPLMANPDKTRAWQQRSRDSQRLDTDERAVRDAVFRRDGYQCQLRDVEPDHRCYGPLTFQHRRKASAQGAYSVANGATLCADGNRRIEQDADLAELAHQAGLVVREGDPEFEALGRRAAREGG